MELSFIWRGSITIFPHDLMKRLSREALDAFIPIACLSGPLSWAENIAASPNTATLPLPNSSTAPCRWMIAVGTIPVKEGASCHGSGNRTEVFGQDDAWRALAKGTTYRQGYLNSIKERTVRIRTVGDKAFLTIKGPTVGATRMEYEYEIPLWTANDARCLGRKAADREETYRVESAASSGR